ncbi:MAG: hypothetical protein AAGF23_11625, partial [Acidobacteriota bacterium]
MSRPNATRRSLCAPAARPGPGLRALIAAGLALWGSAGASGAATIHVDGVVCSLVDAVVAANTDGPAGGCPQGDPGADLVVLDADVTLLAAHPGSTVYQGVAAGLPDVTDDLTIAAGAAAVIRRDPTFTCDASTADPVFRFLNLEAGSLRLEGLTFEGGCFVAPESGSQGGGIRAGASTEITLDRVTVRDFGAFSTVGSFQGGFLLARGDRVAILDLEVDGVRVDVSSSLQGGVLYLDTDGEAVVLDGSTFRNLSVFSSSSVQGGVLYGQSDLRVDGTTVENLALAAGRSLQGGAFYVSASDATHVLGSSFRLATLFIGGDSSIQGGVLYVRGSSGTALRLADSTFTDIDSVAAGACDGGAIYASLDTVAERLAVERCSCGSVTARADGGAARFTERLTLRDSVFRGNEALASGSLARGGAVSASDIALAERSAFVDNRAAAAASMGGLDAEGGG